MTTTAAEADDLIETAIKQNVKLVASPGEMIHPLKQKMRQLVLAGTLGTITWAMTGATFGEYHQDERVRQGDDVLTNINPAWYFRRPGGGPLYDMTVYGLHALTGILGPAQRVTAFSGVRLAERAFRGEMLPVDMDDNTLMVLDFGNSLYAFVYGAAAGRLPFEGRPLFIMGTRGVISGNMLNGEAITYPDLEDGLANASGAALPHIVGPHRDYLEEAHVFEDVMQLVDWVREGKESLATAEHARHVIEIFEAAYHSAQTGQAQELRTTFEAIAE
jgi:predicted dehydrogenase